LPGGTCTHWKAPPFHGARQKKTKEILEYARVSSRVETVKKTSWRVYGKYLNPEGVLVGQIVGNEDKPLCYIATRDGQSSIDVNIRFRVDQNYTWLRLDHTSQDRPVLEIIRAYFIKVGKNKEAMVKASLAKALKRRARTIDDAPQTGKAITLARHQLHEETGTVS